MEVSVDEPGNKRFTLGGFHDYTIGHSKRNNVYGPKIPDESHIVAVEAKKTWQCWAEAATLHKIRKNAGKENCNVRGVLSNAFIWKFVKIDHDGKFWQTDDYHLNLERYNEEQLLGVYCCLHHIIQGCYRASPTPSPVNPAFDVPQIVSKPADETRKKVDVSQQLVGEKEKKVAVTQLAGKKKSNYP